MSSSHGQRLPIVRGPLVNVEPHPHAFEESDFEAYKRWASDLPSTTAIDLFCGAGGLSLGLQEAGIEVVLGVDNDEAALQTHKSISPGLSVNWDLSDEANLKKIIDIGVATNVDMVVGGPPCQPFSKAGRAMLKDLVRSGRRPSRDERRDLWQSFVRVVEGVRPKAVLMENVPDMALDRDMQILRTMVDLLESLSYSVSVRILNLSRFEVPQYRHRLILVALQNEKKFTWPTESEYQVSLRAAIGDLPPIKAGWDAAGDGESWIEYGGPNTEFQTRARRDVPTHDGSKIFDHITRAVREDDRIIFSAMDSTTAYSEIDDAVAQLATVSGESVPVGKKSLKRYRDDIFDDKYKRLDWGKVSRTITAHISKDGYWYIHPDQDRTLTIREAARIQTFPDHIRFAGYPSSSLKQIGNAVPPRIGELLGQAIIDSLDANHLADESTLAVSKRLAVWFEERYKSKSLYFPWLHSKSVKKISRWLVLQAEILLGKSNEHTIKTVWPLLQRIDTPQKCIDRSEEVRELAAWVDRAEHAEQLLVTAAWFQKNEGAFDTIDQMLHAPNVTNGLAQLAARVVPDELEEPVFLTSGLARIAQRFIPEYGGRAQTRSDSRLVIGRLIGAEDGISDYAYLSLHEIAAEICQTRNPNCANCPLAPSCATGQQRLISAPRNLGKQRLLESVHVGELQNLEFVEDSSPRLKH